MADQIIDIPEVGQVAFPDTMSDQDIAQVARNLHLKAMNAKDISMEGIRGEDPYHTMWRGAKAMAGGVGSGILGVVSSPYTIPRDLATKGPVQMAKDAAAGIVQTGKDLVSGDPERAGHAGGNLLVAAAVPGVVKMARATPNALVSGGTRLQEMAADLPKSSPVPASTMPVAVARATVKPAARAVGSAMETTGRKLGGNLPFARRPLYEQIPELPTDIPLDTPPPNASVDPIAWRLAVRNARAARLPEGRVTSAPPATQGTINDLPLVKQMDMLPREGAMPEGRMSSPLERVGSGESMNTAPYNQQPLYKQMEQLPPTEAPAPNPRRMNAARNELKPGEDLTPELAEAHRLYDEMIAKGYSPIVASRISGYK